MGGLAVGQHDRPVRLELIGQLELGIEAQRAPATQSGDRSVSGGIAMRDDLGPHRIAAKAQYGTGIGDFGGDDFGDAFHRLPRIGGLKKHCVDPSAQAHLFGGAFLTFEDVGVLNRHCGSAGHGFGNGEIRAIVFATRFGRKHRHRPVNHAVSRSERHHHEGMDSQGAQHAPALFVGRRRIDELRRHALQQQRLVALDGARQRFSQADRVAIAIGLDVVPELLVAMGDDRRGHRSVASQRDEAPVGEVADRHASQRIADRVDVECRRERVADLDHKLHAVTGALLLVDVGGRSDPPNQASLIVEDRYRTREEPAIAAVDGAEAVLLFVRLSGFEYGPPSPPRFRDVVGVEHPDVLAPALELVEVDAGIVNPAAVEVFDGAVGPCRPDELRHGIGNRTKLRAEMHAPWFLSRAPCIRQGEGSEGFTFRRRRPRGGRTSRSGD